jgi:hypothetical protein
MNEKDKYLVYVAVTKGEYRSSKRASESAAFSLRAELSLLLR